MGQNQKIRNMTSDVAYVVDPKTGKTTKTDITSVAENPANPHYVRRNIMTKGAIIDTKLGKAKITFTATTWTQKALMNSLLPAMTRCM